MVVQCREVEMPRCRQRTDLCAPRGKQSLALAFNKLGKLVETVDRHLLSCYTTAMNANILAHAAVGRGQACAQTPELMREVRDYEANGDHGEARVPRMKE